MTQDHQKYILSIDLGTSGSKTAIVSIHGEVVDFDFESVPLLLSRDFLHLTSLVLRRQSRNG